MIELTPRQPKPVQYKSSTGLAAIDHITYAPKMRWPDVCERKRGEGPSSGQAGWTCNEPPRWLEIGRRLGAFKLLTEEIKAPLGGRVHWHANEQLVTGAGRLWRASWAGCCNDNCMGTPAAASAPALPPSAQTFSHISEAALQEPCGPVSTACSDVPPATVSQPPRS